MRGIDAAALVEVVEHLEPSPLRRLGPALLGGLRPRLLVVTTPNLEYNALLHALGSVLLPNRLRNSDHRFEWCAHARAPWNTVHVPYVMQAGACSSSKAMHC